MEIINVVEIYQGILNSIESYPIFKGYNAKERGIIVKQAEDYFRSLLVDVDEETAQAATLNGRYSDEDWDILITWSNVHME